MKELPKAYEPNKTEKKWYHFWESKGFFQANPDSNKPPFCIVIPPPNVTGSLHMGHALTNTLQDILIRWKRMQGFEALWVPGTDHAGIATQTVVERNTIATMGKRRKDFNRDDFMSLVWDWKEKNENHIINQLKKLGCSCDWSRQRFTMDDGCNAAVRSIFKKMYDDGLIYRGDYLVNWDPITQTALADDEVEYEERDSFLWYLKYPLEDGSGYISIATTRPETMLGDTAIAVSPKDDRYSQHIGKNVKLPITNRIIPIISDHHVDPEFGTGAVKITPAHDANDYQIGMEHKLPFINIMTPDGHINENGGEFVGLSMSDARIAIIERMKKLKLLLKIESHKNRIGVSYRSKADIEPYMSKQWFIKMSALVEDLQKAVEDNHVEIVPKSWENTYFHWINNLRDWCISRQLWWGHRIPIWYNKEDPDKLICYEGDGVPPEVKSDPEMWTQDEDVLDTWFSSAFWPFSALGWPQQTAELDKFYPNSILITGHDILFFWVARMISMGKYNMQEYPFKRVFLHGLIYGKSYWRKKDGGGIEYVSEKERLSYDLDNNVPSDVYSKWEKMSKSKGNIIDPLEIIDLYGTDAVRMTLCATPSQLREIDLDRRKFEEFKNFANKIWNSARFIFKHIIGDENLKNLSTEEMSCGLDITLLSLADKWILSRLNSVVESVNIHLEALSFDHAALAAYDFFWKEFCAYYLEIVKPILYGKQGTSAERTNTQKILTIILCSAIRILHPIAPYITEEIFQNLKEIFGNLKRIENSDSYTNECIEALNSESCMIASYPIVINKEDINDEVEREFEFLQNVIYTVRNIRGEMKLAPSVSTDIFITDNIDCSGGKLKIIENNKAILSALLNHRELCIGQYNNDNNFVSTGVIDSLKIIIPLPKELCQQELKRLEKERTSIEQNIDKINNQLSNKNFCDRAPKELVEKQQQQLERLQHELKEINNKLSLLNK